jgi:DNA polymerase-3 subunit epsilon
MSAGSTLFEACVELGDPVEESLKRIPAKRGLALLQTADERPIVLLPAADMRARVRNRLSDPSQEEQTPVPDLASITRSVCYLRTFGHFETDWAYMEIARNLWPDGWREMVTLKLPWFVHLDTQEPAPHFRRGRDVFRREGLKIGPFPTARAAEGFIEILQELFLLCRNPACLAEAPDASPCTYGQMGKCLRPCDGTTSLEEYRKVLGRAGEFAAGRRGEFRKDLQESMSQAAADLDFEQAGACKKRLERLDELDRPEFALARPLDQHRWLIIQPGPTFHQAKVFVAAPGTLAAAPMLDYPLVDSQLQRTSASLEEVADAPPELDEVDRYRLALICRLMYSSPARKGLLIDARHGVSPTDLAGRIEAACDVLGLRAPRRKKASRESVREQKEPPTDK